MAVGEAIVEYAAPYLADRRVQVGLAAALTATVIWLTSGGKKKKYKLPPGPWALPVIGNVRELFMESHMFKSCVALTKKYGDVYIIGLGSTPCVILNNIDLVREAFVKKQNDFAGRWNSHSNEVFSEGCKDIICGDFSPVWKQQRKIAHQAIRKYAMGSHLEGLMQDACAIVDKVIEDKKGESFDPFPVISLFVYNIICGMVFGRSLKPDDPFFLKFSTMMDNLNEELGSGTAADWVPIMKYVPTPGQRKLKQFCDYWNGYLHEAYDEHKKNFDPNNVTDLTYHVIENEIELGTVAEDGTPLDSTHYAQIMSDMFLAGTDTSRYTIMWALKYLILHPELQTRAQKEIDDVVGPTQAIRPEHRPKLPFIDACIYESMRIRPVAPMGVPHQTTCDTSVGGYDLPEGMSVWSNIWALHMDPRQWDAPEEFRPDRFLDETGNLAPKPNSFLPFSAGRRQCVGESLAKTEIPLVLSMMLQKYTFTPDPSEKFDCELDAMWAAAFPTKCKVIATPR